MVLPGSISIDRQSLPVSEPSDDMTLPGSIGVDRPPDAASASSVKGSDWLDDASSIQLLDSLLSKHKALHSLIF